MLFHYNGHGVPRPTANGEIWVFNKSYTQYIPMSIYDLQAWVGSPAIYTFDCSAAGLIINSFRAFAEQRSQVSARAWSDDCCLSHRWISLLFCFVFLFVKVSPCATASKLYSGTLFSIGRQVACTWIPRFLQAATDINSLFARTALQGAVRSL